MKTNNQMKMAEVFGEHAFGHEEDSLVGTPPFDNDGDGPDAPGREGLGNLGPHPSDLGDFLDCVDQDDEDDPDPDECG